MIRYIKIRPAETAKAQGPTKGGAMVAVDAERRAIAIAVCSPRDVFSNEIGRRVCIRRLNYADFVAEHMLTEVGRKNVVLVCGPGCVANPAARALTAQALSAAAALAGSFNLPVLSISERDWIPR